MKGALSAMVNQFYPRLEINLRYLKDNVTDVVKKCSKRGIDVVGVIKGTTGLLECAEQFVSGGVKMLASSRLEQIDDAKAYGIDIPYMLLRVPMLSEVPEVVRLTDISLNSELSVLESLNKEASNQNKIHKVILMVDLGDLREGFWNKNEALYVAKLVENEMDNLILAGIGTNLGCYGSIVATKDKLNELVSIAEEIETAIGHKLEYISGGATTSLPRVYDGDIPDRINMLRIGEGILLSREMSMYYGYKQPNMHTDVYTLKAEVIESRVKPSYPIGEIFRDAFGNTPEYMDRGIRKRVLLGIGKVDYGSIDGIFPRFECIEVIGASSDHTILDVEECSTEFKPGDIIEFDIDYSSIVYLTNCRNVQIIYV